MKNISFLTFIVLFLIVGCSGTEVLMQSTQQQEKIRTLKQYVERSETLNDYFFGMQLYDLQQEQVVFEVNDERFFSPASVNKWLTLYTASHYLADSLVWLSVYEQDDRHIYQPMGDPSFLHPKLTTPHRIENYFSALPKDTIYWFDAHFTDNKYGSGWAWDDHFYSFQTQKSSFPIHSNLLQLKKDSIQPNFIPAEVYYEFDRAQAKVCGKNQFFVNVRDSERLIPFEVNDEVLAYYFLEQGKQWQRYTKPLDNESLVRQVYSQPSINAYRLLMQNSDNHIAEQLLLQASQLTLGEMNTKAMILRSKEELLPELAKQIEWVDGSGLSRYNMITPNAVVAIINKMVAERGIDWLQNVLPAGGKSGTIKNNYVYEPARVFAKTGTLRHNHNLAGVVQAKSGKWYSFSMMNNHYNGSSAVAKAEMENLIKLIVENY